MAIRTVAALQVADQSQVGNTRRTAASIAESLGFGERDAGKAAIIITELATNIVKHAGEGEIIVNAIGSANSQSSAIEILALDRGPGIPNIAEALRDGYSTLGSPGTGLGAVQRLASTFELYSIPGKGAALLATLSKGLIRPPGTPRVGGLSVPKVGETVCGDAWAYIRNGHCTRVIVADGLGHGEGAAQAAMAALNSFSETPRASITDVLTAMHTALRPTRGAVAAIAEVDPGSRLVRYGGIGNIFATIVTNQRDFNMVSHNGTLGHEARKFHEFTYPWPEGALMVLHSDGVSHRWDMQGQPGLAARSTTLIAGVIYRDHGREHDDATVVVLKDESPGGGR